MEENSFLSHPEKTLILLLIKVCLCVCVSGVRCWPVNLDVSVLDQQLKLFVSRHSAFLSEDVPGETTRRQMLLLLLCLSQYVCVCVTVCICRLFSRVSADCVHVFESDNQLSVSHTQ